VVDFRDEYLLIRRLEVDDEYLLERRLEVDFRDNFRDESS
jgi:hypothetical protein